MKKTKKYISKIRKHVKVCQKLLVKNEINHCDYINVIQSNESC
jgi:hypothetical protein